MKPPPRIPDFDLPCQAAGLQPGSCGGDPSQGLDSAPHSPGKYAGQAPFVRHSFARRSVARVVLITVGAGALVAGIMLVLVPLLDTLIFRICTKSISSASPWAYPWTYFWGLINHRQENVILPAIFGCLLLRSLWKDPSWPRWRSFLAFVVVLEVFMGALWLWHKIPWTARQSPSLVVPDFVSILPLLPDWLGRPEVVKVTASRCFPSGHGFAGIYWALAGRSFVSARMRPWLWVLVTPSVLSRIFVGAHWASDVAVGGLLAYGAFQVFVRLAGRQESQR